MTSGNTRASAWLRARKLAILSQRPEDALDFGWVMIHGHPILIGEGGGGSGSGHADGLPMGQRAQERLAQHAERFEKHADLHAEEPTNERARRVAMNAAIQVHDMQIANSKRGIASRALAHHLQASIEDYVGQHQAEFPEHPRYQRQPADMAKLAVGAREKAAAVARAAAAPTARGGPTTTTASRAAGVAIDPKTGHARVMADALPPDNPAFRKIAASAPDDLAVHMGMDQATDSWGHGGVPALGHLYDAQNFHGKPRIGTDAEIRAQIKAGGLPVARGLQREDHLHDFMYGEKHFPGTGFYGNGSYFGHGPNAKEVAQGYAGESGRAVHGVLHPEAKIGHYEDIDRQRVAERAQNTDPMLDRHVYADVGHFAAAKGYDAYTLHGVLPYTVVLNRSALTLSPKTLKGRKQALQ